MGIYLKLLVPSCSGWRGRPTMPRYPRSSNAYRYDYLEFNEYRKHRRFSVYQSSGDRRNGLKS